MNNKIGNMIKERKSPNDKIYTPKPVALLMINMCNIKETDKVLDPCLGGGVFYNNLPKCIKSWCEIDKNKDYFDFNEKVDLVIGNPPYSLINKWLEHTIKITDKFCFIIGINNLTPPRIRLLEKNNFGITKIHMLQVGWWFGRSIIIIVEKNKKSIIDCSDNSYNICDNCNNCYKKCGRGSKFKNNKFGMNECIFTHENLD